MRRAKLSRMQAATVGKGGPWVSSATGGACHSACWGQVCPDRAHAVLFLLAPDGRWESQPTAAHLGYGT